MNAHRLGRIQLLHVDGGKPVSHSEVNGLPSLLVELAQVRQAQASNVKLPYRCLTNREAGNAEVMRTFSIAVQEPGSHQIRQKPMHRTDRQPRKRRHLLCGEAARRLAEKV